MNLLAIETSTEQASAALLFNGSWVSEEHGTLRQHAQIMLPMIRRLLHSSGASLSQLDGIVFGCGPGSFTGLRIACSIAKGLAYACNVPLFPISSLAAIAFQAFEEQAPESPSRTLILVDARMQQLYWAEYNREYYKADVRVSFPSEVVSIAEPLILAGTGFQPYLDKLPLSLQENIIQQKIIYPHARALIHLVETGQFNAVSAAEALPVYVRNQVTGGGSRG